MAVPNTTNFSFIDVKNEIENNGGTTTNSLIEAFANANANGFDSSYEGEKNSLLNFRKYSHNVTERIFSFTTSESGYLNLAIRDENDDNLPISWSSTGSIISSGSDINNMNFNGNSLSEVTIVVFTVGVRFVYLDCGGNAIKSIDTSELKELSNYRCDNNQLSSLDLSANTNLEELRCYYNPFLTSLDLSNNINLLKISSHRCAIVAIDLSNNLLLEELDFSSNNIVTTIDVSLNVVLSRFTAYNNGMVTVDFTNNPLLNYIAISDNSLTALDVSNNNLLSFANVSDNNLPDTINDSLLLKLDSNGTVNGTVRVDSRTNATDIAKTNLQGKGWIVYDV